MSDIYMKDGIEYCRACKREIDLAYSKVYFIENDNVVNVFDPFEEEG